VKLVEGLLVHVNRQLQATMIIVSHHIASTMRIADHVVLLLADGAVEGSPAERRAPIWTATAGEPAEIGDEAHGGEAEVGERGHARASAACRPSSGAYARGSALGAAELAGDPSTAPSANSRTTWSAMRMVGRDVVRHDDHGRLQLAVDVYEEPLDELHGQRIEAGEGLVAEEDHGLHDDRPRQRYAFHHAAREAGSAAGHRRWRGPRRRGSRAPRRDLALAHGRVLAQREGQVLETR